MTVTSPVQVTVTGAYGWAAAGNDGPDPGTDSGRLLTVGWVPSNPSAISLLRELHWDGVSKQLVSSPLPEYTLLHNGTLHQGAVTVPAGQNVHIPAGDGGTVDL